MTPDAKKTPAMIGVMVSARSPLWDRRGGAGGVAIVIEDAAAGLRVVGREVEVGGHRIDDRPAPRAHRPRGPDGSWGWRNHINAT